METLISCLTPPGKAAIATLGVRGSLAWTITYKLFKPRGGALPDEPIVGKYWYGKLGIEHADDVVLAVKEDGVELHCHGGVEVVRMIQELYEERGAAVVPWQQWVADSSGVAALLAQAPTARTAAILLDQADGAWQRAVERIEHGDAAVLRRLRELIPLGQHLVTPWKIVLAGAPNVGKSSLMNALAGFTRSLVAPTAGTTRDAVTVNLAIDGWPVAIVDTAGIRESTSDLERHGIERARNAAMGADLRIWLLDGSTAPVIPAELAGWILVINKIDLPPGWDWARALPALRISALTHAGMVELCEAISRRLVPNPPQPGEALPATAEQAAWIHARNG
jgi:tRNA modification GTPase